MTTVSGGNVVSEAATLLFDDEAGLAELVVRIRAVRL